MEPNKQQIIIYPKMAYIIDAYMHHSASVSSLR